MDKKTLAVFTATYNRAYIISDLYRSLLAQTNQDFCWIVVDDGSTDDTEQLIASFIAENLIPIRYIKQENGGKQRAHNTGVEACNNELFFCVDSDDTLAPTAIEDVLTLWGASVGATMLPALSPCAVAVKMIRWVLGFPQLLSSQLCGTCTTSAITRVMLRSYTVQTFSASTPSTLNLMRSLLVRRTCIIKLTKAIRSQSFIKSSG